MNSRSFSSGNSSKIAKACEGRLGQILRPPPRSASAWPAPRVKRNNGPPRCRVRLAQARRIPPYALRQTLAFPSSLSWLVVTGTARLASSTCTTARCSAEQFLPPCVRAARRRAANQQRQLHPCRSISLATCTISSSEGVINPSQPDKVGPHFARPLQNLLRGTITPMSITRSCCRPAPRLRYFSQCRERLPSLSRAQSFPVL